jgi:FlaG/FlaF family flagellin (archaellin)
MVVAAVLWSTTAGASQPAHHPVVRGAVDALGTPTATPGDWQVARVTTGVYRVRLPDEHVTLDVRQWDAVADVTVRPLGRGVNEVRFDVDGRAVDSGFGFVAISQR